MAADRNRNRLRAGDSVMLTPGMSVNGKRCGRIKAIDGEYIFVTVMVDGKAVDVERYGSEMEKRA